MKIHKEEKGIMTIRKADEQKINTESMVTNRTEKKESTNIKGEKRFISYKTSGKLKTGTRRIENIGESTSKRVSRKASEKEKILRKVEKEKTVNKLTEKEGFIQAKEAVKAGKDYILDDSEEGQELNSAFIRGVEDPYRGGRQLQRFTKEQIASSRARKQNRAIKREIKDEEKALYEKYAAKKGNKSAIRKVNKRIKKESRTKYSQRKIKPAKAGFFKGALLNAKTRLTSEMRGKIFNDTKSSGQGREHKSTDKLISFSGGVLGRSGSLIARLLFKRFQLLILAIVLGAALFIGSVFLVPLAVISSPFGIFMRNDDTAQTRPEDVLRENFTNFSKELQSLSDKNKINTIEYVFNGNASSNFSDILTVFSVLYSRQDGGFAEWNDEVGNSEPQIDENGNLAESAGLDKKGTALIKWLFKEAVSYEVKETVFNVESGNDPNKQEKYAVARVTLLTYEELMSKIEGTTVPNAEFKEFSVPQDERSKVDYVYSGKFSSFTEDEKEMAKEVYDALVEENTDISLPGFATGYGDVLDPNATTIDDGSATAIQLLIAQNARNNKGNFPAKFGWCAAWVGGIYGASGRPTPRGNAIDYWVKWGSPEQASKSNVPIGAAVITTGDPNWGHIGIYIGNGLVASNLGGVKIEPLATFGNSAPVYSGYQQSMKGKQGYLGWVWPDGVALGPTPQTSQTGESSGWKSGTASAYGGWSDAQIRDNAVTATGAAVTETSMGVAIPMSWNRRDLLGHKVLIRYNGKTVTATINDVGGMGNGSRALDLQPGVFKAFGFNSCQAWGLRTVEYKIL